MRGDGPTALPDVLAELPDDALIVVVDSYTAVFFDDDARAQLAATIELDGRDGAWISLDPLIPLGTEARHSVQGLPVDPELVRRNRSGGVFGCCRSSAPSAVGRSTVSWPLLTRRAPA